MTSIGLQITEKEYREIPLGSYSFFSDMQKIEEVTPGEGYKIIGGKVNSEIADMDGVIFGSMVDSLVSDGIFPPNIKIVAKKPSGKMKDMIKVLHNIREFLPEPSNLLSPLNYPSLIEVATEFKYKIQPGQQIAGFINYKEYIDVYSEYDDHMITIPFYANSAEYFSKVINDTFPILNTPIDGIEVLRQVKIVSKVYGVYAKGMLDFVIINHNSKKIIPIDLKTGSYITDNFRKKGYFYWNYYIQASLYRKIIIDEIERNHPELKDYTILPFSFIYCDRMKKSGVIRYDVTQEDDEKALTQGFVIDDVDDNGFNVKIKKNSVKDLLKIYYDHRLPSYDAFVKSLNY